MIPILFQRARGGGASSTLLGAETQGLAIDFTDMSMVIRDTGTPANAFSGDPNSKLTYSSPSTKWILGANGLYSSGTTLRTSYNASGTALGVLIEEARTNLCLQSNDLTDASWTKSNLTTAKTATGPDGVANSATTITASAGNATALQAITSGSAARITSVFLKRRTGTGNIDVTQDNGSTWATQSITSSWARYSITSVTSANPTVGIRVVTSGDAVDVAYFQHELGAFSTSPIVTAGSTVTRAADTITLATSLFPFSTSLLTVYNKSSYLTAASSGIDQTIWMLEISGAFGVNIDRYGASTNIAYRDSNGGVDTVKFVGTTPFKLGTAAQTGAVSVVLNGGSAYTNAGAVAVGSATALRLGSRPGSAFMNGYISQLMYLPRKMSNVELQTVTT